MTFGLVILLVKHKLRYYHYSWINVDTVQSYCFLSVKANIFSGITFGTSSSSDVQFGFFRLLFARGDMLPPVWLFQCGVDTKTAGHVFMPGCILSEVIVFYQRTLVMSNFENSRSLAALSRSELSLLIAWLKLEVTICWLLVRAPSTAIK